MLEPLETRIAPATLTWDGSASNLWNNAANWDTNTIPDDGDILIFPDAALNKTNSNNIAGLLLDSVRISGDSYVLSGNSIGISGGVRASVSGVAIGTVQVNMNVTLTDDATFDNTGMVALEINGNVNNVGHTLTLDGTGLVVIDGNISGTGGGGLTKDGTSVARLNGSNTYTGTTNVLAGVLQLGTNTALGAAGGANVTDVKDGGTLRMLVAATIPEDIFFRGSGVGGNGALFVSDDVTFSGLLSLAGQTELGTDADGNAILTGGFSVGFNGLPSSSGAESLEFSGSGSLALQGVALTLSVVNVIPPAGSVYTIVNNTGTGTITGTFAGLPDGATITRNDQQFTIDYQGGDGNDITLTAGIPTFTWDGGGANANWTTAENWAGNLAPIAGSRLVFPDGAAKPENTNNFPAGTVFESIEVAQANSNLTGNAIVLNGGVTHDTGSQLALSKLSLAITLGADQTFHATGQRNLILAGPIDLAGHVLTLAGDGALRFEDAGAIVGDGEIVHAATTATEFKVANTYTGLTTVAAGLLRLQGAGTLGATGAGNGTVVQDGGRVGLPSSGSVAEDFTISGDGEVDGNGAIDIVNSATLTGAVTLAGNALVNFDGSLFPNVASLTGPLRLDINGTTPGTQFEALEINTGSAFIFDLAGALELGGTFQPAPGTTFTIVKHSGNGGIDGTFTGLPEGARFTQGDRAFTISYTGGAGNDVVLTAVAPLSDLAIAANGKSATFTDVDGDLVTVKTTRGFFDEADFLFGFAADNRQQLEKLALDADFTGANITITAKRGPNGGNGFVNVGQLEAAGVDLGAVSIAGDLGSITAGTIGGDTKVPAVKSLTVQSMGLLGISTQGPTGVPNSSLQGALGKLVVKDDFRNVRLQVFDADGRIGSAQIGGSIVATSEFTELSALAGIGSLKVGGDIRASQTDALIIGTTNGALGAITVGGSIYTPDADEPILFFAFGQPTAPTKGLDLAIRSLTVKGSVENTQIRAGLGPFNADASVGSIAVGGDWIASTVAAGVNPGADTVFGTADDGKVSVATPRDNPALFSTIGSFTVRGQAFGTAVENDDMFGIVAERIGKAKVGGRTFAFTTGATPEAFFAAPTLDGRGAENPAFDFTIRELGSTTPTPDFGGVNLDISSDGKTATFTDVDGDLVTVKRTTGTFVAGDFTIVAAVTGGGRLEEVEITTAAGNLSITAKPGADGGNGRVNVDRIESGNLDLGAVVVAGELRKMTAGDNDPAQPGVRSLAVQSLGTLSGAPGAGFNEIRINEDAPKIIVFSAMRDTDIDVDGRLATITVGGSMLDGSSIEASFLGTVKINGSLLDNSSVNAGKTIGSIKVGGDLVGDSALNPKITAFGPDTLPARGPAVAIGSVTVKGSVESALIETGLRSNPDASIGKIAVGRAWLGSNVHAGVKDQLDNFYGDGTDVSSNGVPGDPTRFSTIASVVIKGQAVGSAATNDTFGIVAEQIGKAKIGAVSFKFDQGERDAGDAFAIGPTGPGATGLVSDFFIREISA